MSRQFSSPAGADSSGGGGNQGKRGWLRRLFLILLFALLLLSPLYLVAFKLGWLVANSQLFTAMVLALFFVLLSELLWVWLRLWRRQLGVPTALARSVLLVGGLLVCGGGTANWLLHFQGFMVLVEGEAVPLFGASHLQHFEAGLLGDPREMHLMLKLAKVKLRPSVAGGVMAETRLIITPAGGKAEGVRIIGTESRSLGVLRLHGGSFGFAPRIKVERAGRTLFDKAVPFTTGRRSEGYRFEGSFSIKEEQLTIHGAVSLEALDDKMRGHPTLQLQLSKAGQPLGAGELKPGVFAQLDQGYRIGFAGLKKWVELDISRRGYGDLMRGGMLASALGALAWLAVALWRRRR